MLQNVSRSSPGSGIRHRACCIIDPVSGRKFFDQSEIDHQKPLSLILNPDTNLSDARKVWNTVKDCAQISGRIFELESLLAKVLSDDPSIERTFRAKEEEERDLLLLSSGITLIDMVRKIEARFQFISSPSDSSNHSSLPFGNVLALYQDGILTMHQTLHAGRSIAHWQQQRNRSNSLTSYPKGDLLAKLGNLFPENEQQFIQLLLEEEGNTFRGLNEKHDTAAVVRIGEGRISFHSSTGAGFSEWGEERLPDNICRLSAFAFLNGHAVAVDGLHAPSFSGDDRQVVAVGTPSLSSLVSWDHSVTYDMQPFCSQWKRIQEMNSTSVKFHFDVTSIHDEFLYDHKIDERILFPATAYLMLAWTSFLRVNDFQKIDLFANGIVFREISFLRATVLSLTKTTSFFVRLNQETGRFVIVTQADSTAVCTGFIHATDRREREEYARYESEVTAGNQDQLQHRNDSIILETKDVYKELRVRGYDYGFSFQGIYEIESGSLEQQQQQAGKLIWRNVIPKRLRPSDSLEKTNATIWLRNWIPFADSLLQLSILHPGNISRGLFVPTFIQQLSCFPQDLQASLQQADSKILDPFSGEEAAVVGGHINQIHGIAFTQGLLVKEAEKMCTLIHRIYILNKQ